MKKNKMMRIASVLLVLTLISTCAISGTFAKYVTKAEGSDSARVAKWGIVVEVNGKTVFADKYAAEDEDYLAAGGTYSVEAKAAEGEEADKVVAPGTDSTQVGDDLLTAKVSGTPEVATRYTLVISDWEDIVLPKGEYTDYTQLLKADDGTYGYTGKFTTDADYAPIKWNFTVTKGSKTVDLLAIAKSMLPAEAQSVVKGFSATEAKVIMKEYADALADLLEQQVTSGAARNAKVEVADDGTITLSMDFDPNAEMDYTFALSWEWAFEGPTAMITSKTAGTIFDATLVDQCDTYLGNVIAEVVDDQNAKTTITANIVASATQID